MCVRLCVSVCERERGRENKGERDRLTVCFPENLSSFLTDGGHQETVVIICAGYWLYCTSRHINHFSTSRIPQLYTYIHRNILGRRVVITRGNNISLCLCSVSQLDAEQNAPTKAWDTALKKPACGTLCAFKAGLIDKTHDWVTDYTGCFTFCACLVSQEDVETTSYWFYFPRV